jgi:L-ascorbate metabolism protein UlaG (beta-lactamase superfamily)
MFHYKGLEIIRFCHDSFLVSDGKINIYFDPFKLHGDEPKADYIFISHEHFDHFSPDDIHKVIKDSTVLFMNEMTNDEIDGLYDNKIVIIRPGDSIDFKDLRIKGIPAYNINKFREPGKVYHPKEDKKLGFIVTFNGVKIYHTGDTDHIPEMDNLASENIDLLFIPVSGTYVMAPAEAIEAALKIKADTSIPMHYGTIVGEKKQAEEFKEGVQKKGLKSEIV